MKKLIPIASLLGAVLLATPAVAGTRPVNSPARADLSSQEAKGLRSLEANDLGSLRAGDSVPSIAVGAAERAALTAATARDTDLGALSAGEITLSDRDVQIIVIVAVVVLILILI